MYRLSLLPVGLIALLLSTPAFAAEPTTPPDPFHHISKFTQRPPEPPICCLRPLPSSEPAEEILSFEDWKTRQEQLQREQAGDGSSSRDASAKSNSQPSDAQDTRKGVQFEAGPLGGHASALEPPAPPPPHFRVPLDDRFNYASLDCSARVHYAHRSARSSSSLLSSKKDKYMLSPCDTPGEDKFVIVELCEDIRIDTVQLANFEFFSGVFKDFSVSVARTSYTTDLEGWTPAGTYRAKNIRGIQSFHPPTSLRDFYRFIRIDFHSHYGNEFYCPISLLRVYGLTHLEQWKWEVWEAEYEAKNAGSAIRSIAATPENAVHVEKVALDAKALSVSSGDSSQQETNSSPSETVNTTISATKSTETGLSEPVSTSVEQESSTTESSGMNEGQSTAETSLSNQLGDLDNTATATPVPSSTPSGDTSAPSDSSPASSSDSSLSFSQPHSLASSVPNESSSGSQSSISFSESHQKPNSTTSSSSTSSTPVTTIVAHESRSVPTVSATGESIYRTIMTRLSLLEGNSTLYLRYVEEQTRSLRDALTRLEEDVGRLEGLSKATTQSFQKIINEMDRQRRRLEREHGELQTRVDYLADEVILEKRLGIAQLSLLLTVLVFMALTRGSRGEPFMAPISPGRRDSLREWGRRHLSSLGSGEWASKLRSRSRSRTPVPEDSLKRPVPKKADKVKFPTRRVYEDADPTLRSSSTDLVGPAPAKARTVLEVRAPHSRHRPRTPTSASFAGYALAAQRSVAHHVAHTPSNSVGSIHGSGSGGGAGRPRMRRASSQSTPGPVVHSLSMGEGMSAVPVSVKKWAKSAHLHEIRKDGARRGSDAQTDENATGSTSTSSSPKRFDAEDVENIRESDGGSKISIPGSHPGSTADRNEYERNRYDTESRPRAPLSVSSLENHSRSQGQDSSGLETDRIEQSGHPNGGPRIIDLDTESESWVDTDVEGSEVDAEERSL